MPPKSDFLVSHEVLVEIDARSRRKLAENEMKARFAFVTSGVRKIFLVRALLRAFVRVNVNSHIYKFNLVTGGRVDRTLNTTDIRSR